MTDKKKDSRSEIIQAAQDEFIAHGYGGARLQNIANQIGVTKAMIHYYFNTKAELFEYIYRRSVQAMFSGLSELLEADLPLFKKIEQLVAACLENAERDPEVLSFVIAETSRNEDWLRPIFDEEVSLEQEVFTGQIEEASSNYVIASVHPGQLLLNIFSLCYYPAVTSSINASLLNNGDGVTASSLAADRQGIVLDTILNWLTA
ncbi:TetR/AcrR family transcriptional regulator [Fodinibius sediminis]|uniref:Transcriptional regulator, TetR family n=1 Tax=Fodinibius sediminis TaxID=1214077 RepID=A0A521BID7_9BACT|nr:TetR/AcrR family transcriptional regulator [Fodinibius sediminis]SMO46826.1 transcriptional regulator, TetR family [Fodinibius sediminis]